MNFVVVTLALALLVGNVASEREEELSQEYAAELGNAFEHGGETEKRFFAALARVAAKVIGSAVTKQVAKAAVKAAAKEAAKQAVSSAVEASNNN